MKKVRIGGVLNRYWVVVKLEEGCIIEPQEIETQKLWCHVKIETWVEMKENVLFVHMLCYIWCEIEAGKIDYKH